MQDASVFDLSVSPDKPGNEDDRMAVPSARRRMDNSRTPTDRGTSRSTSVKRAPAAPMGRPPRRRPDSPWDDDLRAVHRRVQFPEDP